MSSDLREELNKFSDFKDTMARIYDLKEKNLVVDEYLQSRPDSKPVTDEMIEKWAKSLCYTEFENPKEDTSIVKLRYLSLIEGARWARDRQKE